MLTAEKIADIFTARIAHTITVADKKGLEVAIASAAATIFESIPDYNAIMVSTAALENEVTSTLLDMLAATILATLIDEEGGGRTNITFSQASMQEKMAAWSYRVETDGMIRTVRITPAKPEEFEEGDGTEIQKGMAAKTGLKISGLGPESDSTRVHPQAEPKEYNRPVWAIRYVAEDVPLLAIMHDYGDANRHVNDYQSEDAPLPEIQNRWCHHVDCPTTGCLQDEKLRDPVPEVTSDAE